MTYGQRPTRTPRLLLRRLRAGLTHAVFCPAGALALLLHVVDEHRSQGLHSFYGDPLGDLAPEVQDRDAIGEHGMEGAPERALSHSWKPQLLCNVTTGIGLASLGLSDLEPIRKFGLYSAAGMLMTLVFLFLFLPAALSSLVCFLLNVGLLWYLYRLEIWEK